MQMKIDEARGNMKKGPFARIQSGEYFEDEKPDTKFAPADKKPKIEEKPEITFTEEQVIQSIAEISDQEMVLCQMGKPAFQKNIGHTQSFTGLLQKGLYRERLDVGRGM